MVLVGATAKMSVGWAVEVSAGQAKAGKKSRTVVDGMESEVLFRLRE